jgi:FtsZ-binding cell division protein ZapB
VIKKINNVFSSTIALLKMEIENGDGRSNNKQMTKEENKIQK